MSSDISTQIEHSNSGPVYAPLPQFGLIRFTGDEAQQFLQAQLSSDVAALQPGQAHYSSYNTHQGRVFANFLLWREEWGYIMLLPRALSALVQQHLSKYILRSQVKAEDISENFGLLGVGGRESTSALTHLRAQLPVTPLTLKQTQDITILQMDSDRFLVCAPKKIISHLSDAMRRSGTAVTPVVWDWFDIRAGIGYVTPSLQEEFVPQMLNLDLIGAISFNKGCYPGQEVVARTHYLGRLKQRMYRARIETPETPVAGDKLYSAGFGEQSSGTIISVTPSPAGGYEMLAVLQIDSAVKKDAHLKSLDGPELEILELPYSM